MASSMTGLVGDSLFEQRIRSDRVALEKLAVELAPVMTGDSADKMQTRIEEAGGELGGRLMALDKDGKVQFDSYSEMNGARLQLPEVLSILAGGQVVDYGVHRLTGDGTDAGQQKSGGLFSGLLPFLNPIGGNNNWVGYCSAAMVQNGQVVGLLLFASPVQEMMENLYALLNDMIYYFLVISVVVLVLAGFFSTIITRPVQALTKSIQRMGKGDFSAKVPVKGSGELRKLAETYNTMSEKLQTLDTSRNQFVSNASHELKTPLATMKIMLESVIYQPDMPEELRTEFLNDIDKEIDRLSSIVTDLLTLVRMDAKETKLNRSSFLLRDMVEENVHRLEPVVEKRQQQIQLQLTDDGELYADRPKMNQVVYNIIENAVKYTQPEGKIVVRLEKKGNDLLLSVQDNGPGIPKADLPHIFDRFYRVDKARSRETGGTGLGLSIAYQIMLMHSGDIHVESEEGKGATFIVEIPAHQG